MHFNTRFVLSFVICVVAFIASVQSVKADTVYSTISSWNEANDIDVASFGPGGGGAETNGEAITAPTTGNDILNNFSFEVKLTSPTSALQFQGEVYAWNGSQATGNSLWQGSLITVPVTDLYDFESEQFNTGGISLNSGQQYILLATSSNGSQNEATAAFGYVGNQHPVSGSSFQYDNNGTSTSELNSAPWTSAIHTIPSELAFTADFSSSSPTPLPKSSLCGLVMLGLFTSVKFLNRKPSV